MAKKGPEATESDILASSGMLHESMPLPPPAPPDEPDPPPPREPGPDDPQQDMLARLTRALEALANVQGRTAADEGALTRLTAAFERMAEAQLEGSDRVARATRITHRPENQAFPNISVFNPRGEKDFPKPPLKYRKVLLPWLAEADSLTREEIELLNLVTPGEYAIRRNDGTRIKLTVRATYRLDSDEIDTLVMNHETAFNNDYHMLMPPLTDMFRQMLKQNPKTRSQADLVLTMDEEEALILAGKLNDGTIPADGRVVSVGE